MIDLLVKAVVGASFVVLISVLTKTRYYFLAGLLPLFPTFTLLSHYIVGTTNTPQEFRAVIVFGMLSLIPYFLYLATVYMMYNKTGLGKSMSAGLVVWSAASLILVFLWRSTMPSAN